MPTQLEHELGRMDQPESRGPGEGLESPEVCGSQDQLPDTSDGPPGAPEDGASQFGNRYGGLPHGIDLLVGSDFLADTIGRSVHPPLNDELLAVEVQ